jgi:hypothetical protein
MKNTQALLKEAIADAKAVRETALTQAKLALEEAFAPRISQMFATRLQEEYDLEEDLVDETMDFEKEMEENYSKDTMDDLDEIDLDEILAELNNELNEAKEDDEEDVEEEVEDDEFEMDKGKDEKDKKVEDLTMDELEALILKIAGEVVDGDTDEGEVEDLQNQEDIESEEDFAVNDDDMEDMGPMDEELDAILAELLGEGKKKVAKKVIVKKEEEKEKEDEEKKKLKENLKLALNAVETLRSELNEVNLLNAKLLYVNKIFKAKNLNESQKLKVVKAFDKAETAKEAKLVFESLTETFNTRSTGKTQIRESLGFASKPAGMAAKQTIVESSDFIARMQKLANIK